MRRSQVLKAVAAAGLIAVAGLILLLQKKPVNTNLLETPSAETVSAETASENTSGITNRRKGAKRVDEASQFYFDMSKEGEFHFVTKKPALKLLIYPGKAGHSDLLVRLEVWNISPKRQYVYPINPFIYGLTFRDGSRTFSVYNVYKLPPVNPRLLHLSELAQVTPGNCLSANYLLPNFYKSFWKENLKCKVLVQINYVTDRQKKRTSVFKLSSDWTKVPAP